MAGRTLSKLGDVPQGGEDLVIASERFDGQEVSSKSISHSTFVNVSFYGSEVVGNAFLDCTFVQCYFRDTAFKNSSFVGCRFVDCNFHKAKFSDADFRYAHFRRSVLDYSELRFSAPPEPNLRRDLFLELSRSALETGDEDNARRYRLGAIEAQNEHLWAAVKHESAWYRTHYPLERRIAAGFQLAWHFINKVLWRHGESTLRLLACALVFAFLVFPALMLADRSPGTSFGDLIWLSVSNFVSVDRLSTIPPDSTYLLVVCAIEGLVGIAFAGLVVTLILKAFLRR